MYPAMILSWLFAITNWDNVKSFAKEINNNSSLLSEGWMHMKLTSLVIFYQIYHFYLGSFLKQFKNDTNSKSSKFFWITNEIPTILLILIVFLAYFKAVLLFNLTFF